MSQSTSNPSIPSVISANSSIVPDDGSTLDHHKGARKHSSDETINPATAPDEDEGYVGDHAIDSGEESEDDFIDFTRHKAKKAELTRSESVSYAELHRHQNARRARTSSIKRTVSTKTSRSGSNGTVKKVRSHEGDEKAQEITNI
jgi:[calcium/calmodulin-dependent protein kinase] kinase